MKYILCFLSLIINTISFALTKDTSIHFKKYSIGAITQPFASTNNYGPRIGIQFKDWVKPNIALRATVDYGEWAYSSQTSIDKIVNDTAYKSSTLTYMPLYNVNLGMEIQKKVYKSLYIFAVGDISIGHGTGGKKTIYQKVAIAPDGTNHVEVEEPSRNSEKHISRTEVKIMPAVGIKMMFRRFTIGTELSTTQIGVTNIRQLDAFKSNYWVVDAGINNIQQRFFLGYRL